MCCDTRSPRRPCRRESACRRCRRSWATTVSRPRRSTSTLPTCTSKTSSSGSGENRLIPGMSSKLDGLCLISGPILLGPPLLPNGETQVELTLLPTLTAVQNEQIVRPGQFSQQRCEFWLIAVGFVELHHSPEIAGEVTPHRRVAPPDGLGQVLDGPLAPAFLYGLPADVLADAPVKLDQGRVHGGDGPRFRGVD